MKLQTNNGNELVKSWNEKNAASAQTTRSASQVRYLPSLSTAGLFGAEDRCMNRERCTGGAILTSDTVRKLKVFLMKKKLVLELLLPS